jgi:hypothetical protein
MFDFPLILPSGNKVRVPEITNQDIYTLIKFCVADDIEGFERCINSIIFNRIPPLSIVDKFYVLLFLRIISLGEEITIGLKNSFTNKISLSLNLILEKFESVTPPPNETVDMGRFTIELGIPTQLYFKTIDELYFSLVRSFTYDGIKVDFDAITEEEKQKIYELLPSKFIGELQRFYTNLMTALGSLVVFEENTTFNIDEVNINFLSNQPCHFIKQLYSQDITSFLEFMYQFVNKVGGSFSDFLKLNINDCKIMFNFYVDEVKKQNEELKKQNPKHK